MKKRKSHRYKGILVVTIASTLFMTSGLHAEEQLSLSETLTERTKEFLSDRGRTGSLLGSIIAGAAVANPLAPLLGSVAGFMIGKSSAFSNKDGNNARRQAYLNRSLIPDDGVQVTSLTGLTGKPPQTSVPTVIAGLPVRTVSGNQLEQTVFAELSEETGTSNQSEQAEQLVIVGRLPEDTGTSYQLEQTERVSNSKLPEGTRTSNHLEQTEKMFNTGFSEETGTNNQSEQTVALESTEKTEARNNLPQQLADACSSVQFSQPLSVSCYYYSQ